MIDATACTATFREWCIDAAEEAGREAHLLLLDGDMAAAIESALVKDDVVGVWVDNIRPKMRKYTERAG